MTHPSKTVLQSARFDVEQFEILDTFFNVNLHMDLLYVDTRIKSFKIIRRYFARSDVSATNSFNFVIKGPQCLYTLTTFRVPVERR